MNSNKDDDSRAEDIKGVVRFFTALSDGQRWRILRLLSERKEMNVHELGATLGLSQSNISHHLSVLLERRLVDCRRDGRYVYYWICSKYVCSLLSDFKLGVIQ